MSYLLRVKINNKWFSVKIDSLESDPVLVNVEGEEFQVSLTHMESKNDSDIDSHLPDRRTQKQSFLSPMPGVVVSILVSEGDKVHLGTEICLIETMKIQQILRSSYDGIVTQINIRESEQIKTGQSILEITEEN